MCIRRHWFFLLILFCILGFSLTSFAAEHNQERMRQKLLNVEREWREAALFPRLPQAPPPNDLCAGAEVIPASGPFPYLTSLIPNITDATDTDDPPGPSCQPLISRSVWYKFTPAATATYDLSLCSEVTGTTVMDTVMAVYTSSDGTCGGSFAEQACNDDDDCIAQGLQSSLSATLSAGTTYYVLVYKFDTPPPTSGHTAVQLQVSQSLAPTNDNCSGIVPALSLDTPVMGALNSATTDDFQLSGPACFNGIGQTESAAEGRDVVYSFTPPADGSYSFKVNSNGLSDTVLYVADNCAPGPAPATVGGCIGASNRNPFTSPASEEVMCIPLTGGTTYWVYVDEDLPTTGTTNFSLEVNACLQESEPNDTPPIPSTLACGVEGSINPAGDFDYYDLGTPAANSRVFAMAEGLGANDDDFDMRITTDTDTLQYDDSNNDIPFGDLAPNCSGTILTGVQSYVEINHHNGAVASEPYRLYAVVQGDSSSATPESEPNNTIATATTGANNYFSGSINPSADVDFFKVLAAAGDLLVVQLDTDPTRTNSPFNGALALVDANNNVLIAVDDFHSTSNTTSGAGNLFSVTPFSPGEALTWRVRTAGHYYVRVTSSGGASSGAYLLSISKNCVGGGGGGAALADLSVTNTDSPDPVVPFHNIVYTITAANAGPDPADTATLTDVIPANTTFFGLSAPGSWTCSTPQFGSTGTVSCTNPSQASGASDQFLLTVQVNAGVPSGTIITNTVVVSAATQDFDLSNNTATTTTTVQCPTITVSPSTLPGGTVGTVYNQTVTASGGASGGYTFSSTGTLPTGVTLDMGTGVLSGTLSAAGTFNFTIIATDGDGCTGSQAYSVTITCPTITLSPAFLPGGQIGVFYNQQVTPSGGTGPYSFSFTGTLPGGLSLDSATGILSGTPSASGTFNFTIIATDVFGCAGSRAYSVFICPVISILPASLPGGTLGQPYSQTLTGSGGNAPYTFSQTSGTLPNGLTLSGEGVISGTPTAEGTFNFVVQVQDSNGCLGSQSYSITICAQITVSPASLPDGILNVPYSQTVSASGGTAPYTFSFTGTLPTGLSLDVNTGVLAGTPSAAGAFNFTITVTDSAGCTASQSYTININCPGLTLSPPTLPGGKVGTPYSQTVTASGGTAPFTYSVSTGVLPNGLSLNVNTGVISGTPTTVETQNFTITATDADGCKVSQSYTIAIIPACLFCDDFNDGVLAQDWTYVKPLWTEPLGGNLIGKPTGRKAIAIATPVFAGCANCSVEATIATAGGTGNRIWLLGWYTDKKNDMELMMKQESNKWILKERINGSIVAKAKGTATIALNQLYDVVIVFNGTAFTVTVDGTQLISLPAHGAHFGTVGFQVKGTTGTFGLINVN